MKKITVLLLIVVLCLSLGACKISKSNTSDSSTEASVKVTWATEVTSETAGEDADAYYFVYVGKTEYTAYAVKLDQVEVTEGAFSVLSYLKENEGLNFEYSVGDWGAFITSVGDMTPEGNEYISLYTTYDEDKNVPGPYTTEMTVDGKSFVTAGVGASSMHVVGGQSILLTLDTY